MKSICSITLLLGVLVTSSWAVPLPEMVKKSQTIDKQKLTINESVNRSIGGFDAENVMLQSWLDLSEFGNVENGNDCWGYTSASGREYALMGLSNKMAVVEITNPTNPMIVDTVSHSNSLWADIKVYQNTAYVSNESGGGIDVVDLSNVDNGVVTLVQRMTTGGLSHAHSLAVDPESGFLYVLSSDLNNGRLVAFNLSNPNYPVLAGEQNGGPSFHDAQIYTYTSGPYAGRQICFGAAGGSGLYILDVTNKSNMFMVSQTNYSGMSYSHQCWLGDNQQYLYLNDELDSIAETRVFDVSDLNNPVNVNSFGWGANSIDHNLYIKDNILYEANYTSGLRVFDLGVDPVDPPMIGFFDTYPSSNNESFNGLWSCFPMFESGTIIGSDIQRGLFVWEIGFPDPCDTPVGSCATDIDGSGAVGVSDLLAIIDHWNECGDGTFRPTGDVDGDCCVNISDLLQVIGVWDEECVIMGACCLGKGTCEEITQSNCSEVGGIFTGDDTLCSATNCPGAGDECVFAMTAHLGQNPFETLTATPSSPEPDSDQCQGTYMSWDNSQDIWLAWTAEFTGNAHFTTCDYSSYDTSMALYEGTCNNQVTCNGDGGGDNDCQSYYSAFDYNVSEGTTYYIRIGGWYGATGAGILTIE